MNKTELISAIAEKTGYSKKDITSVIEATTTVITDTLKNGDEVSIAKFGKFVTTDRAARTAVNPQNPSEKINVPACKVAKFKASSALKDMIKNA